MFLRALFVEVHFFTITLRLIVLRTVFEIPCLPLSFIIMVSAKRISTLSAQLEDSIILFLNSVYILTVLTHKKAQFQSPCMCTSSKSTDVVVRKSVVKYYTINHMQ